MQARTLLLVAGVAVAGVLLYMAWPNRAAHVGSGSGSGTTRVDASTRARIRPPPRLGDFVPRDKSKKTAVKVPISGRVRLASTGRGIAKVKLRFKSASGEGTAISGSGGAYRLRLPAGTYRVTLRAEHYVAPAPAPELTIVAGARVSAVDFRIYRAAVVSGRVVDARGQGIDGAEVRIARDRFDVAPAGQGAGQRRPSAAGPGAKITRLRSAVSGSRRFDTAHVVARTNSRGLFSLEVAPVVAVLRARTRDGKKEALGTPLYLRPGARVAGVELVIGGGLTIGGRVVGPKRQQVKGAQVIVRDDRGVRVLPCSDDGAFDIGGFGPGIKLVQAVGSAYSPSRVRRFSVRARARTKLILRLSPRKSVRGRVLDAAGKPAVGALVSARAGAPGQRLLQLAPPATARTDERGAFKLDGVVDLPLRVVARAADGSSATVRTGVPPKTKGLVLRLRGSGKLVGRVTASGGRRVPFFTLFLRGPAGVRAVNVASASGDYTVDKLMAGTYTVTIAAPRLAPVRKRKVSVVAGGAARVDVALEDGGRISGQVVDKRGQPVPGAVVTMETGFTDEEVVSDSAGAFLLRDVARGRRSVKVAHPRFDTRIVTGINVFAGRTAVARVELTPHGGKGPGLKLSGIGAVLKQEKSYFVVLKVLPSSPAEIAGLQKGDHIIEINGRLSNKLTFADAIEAIRGLVGTAVRLRCRRGDKLFAHDVIRAEVSVPKK